jgi:hypothetical protein
MRISIFLISIFLLSSCQYKGGNAVLEDSIMSDSANLSIDDYQYFNECGFAIKAPCLLEDVSQQASGNFFLNYGGVINEGNPSRMAAYQVIVNRLPIGYKDLSKHELSNLVDDLMKKGLGGFSNSKAIKFSYNEYPGYVAECTTKGYAQKGVMFWKDNFIICLTVITNDELDKKFNKFTNSFKDIELTNINAKSSQEISMQPIKEIGYSLYIPCDLRKAEMQGFDIYYDGAINGESQEKAIVYKIMANKLPLPFSKMNAYDKKTIKQNLINYLRSKGNYKKWEAPISSHFAYIANSTEQGFKMKEALILDDDMVIELVMFSKLNIDTEFKDFINSIKPI